MTPKPIRAVREMLGLDPRSLAVLRVGLAACTLVDLAVRACDLRAHYTDAGVLSRADALSLYGFLHDWPLCVHMAGGSTWSAALFFAATAGAGRCVSLRWSHDLRSAQRSSKSRRLYPALSGG